MQNNEVKIDNFLDINIDDFDPKKITKEKAYICLDSANLKPTFLNETMSWSFNLVNYALLGQVRTLVRLSNCISVKIKGARLPYYTEMNLFDENRVSLAIAEFIGQSFVYFATRFHFLGEAKIYQATTSMDVDFYNFNRGNFCFNENFDIINSFTLRAFNPLSEINLPRQIRYARVISTAPLTVEFSSIHRFVANAPVIISEFKSTDVDFNNAVNGPQVIAQIVDATTIAFTLALPIAIVENPYLVVNYLYFQTIVPLELEFYDYCKSE